MGPHNQETGLAVRPLGLLAGAFALVFYLTTPKATFAYEFWYVSGIAALTGLVISMGSWLWPSWRLSTVWGRLFAGISLALPLAMMVVAYTVWAKSFR